MTRTLPPWYATLAGSETLRERGFRFLPADAQVPGEERIRVGDVGGFGAAVARGIGLVLRTAEPGTLYARFADDYHETLTPDLDNEKTLSFAGLPPLVEVPVEPAEAALVELYERYVKPGSTLPSPGPFVGARPKEAGERVMCFHEDFKRLRVPLGLIPADDPDDPEATIDQVVEIERALVFNGFLTMYQWTLHSGHYTGPDGESFTTPYTSMDTLFSRSLVTLDCRYSFAGCHITLEVDYPPEPSRATVAELLRGFEADHWPGNDQLPDDLPYDVVGAVAAMGIQLQSAATQREWLAEGDESTLISQYFVHTCDDLLTSDQVNERLRELVTPLTETPQLRELVERIVSQHELTI